MIGFTLLDKASCKTQQQHSSSFSTESTETCCGLPTLVAEPDPERTGCRVPVLDLFQLLPLLPDCRALCTILAFRSNCFFFFFAAVQETGGPKLRLGQLHFAAMTTVERKDQIVTWNGDPVHWGEYVKRVRLQYERTEWRKRSLLGAELASRLTGRAWDVASSELDHDKLQRQDGAAYLLQFLEERLCKAPIPDTGQRLDDFFMKLRRVPGTSMAEWAAQLRESYRRLQRAMARQRKDQLDRYGPTQDKTPKSATVSPSKRSDATTPAVNSPSRTRFGMEQAPEAPVAQEHVPPEPDDPGRPNAQDDGYAEVPQSDAGSNPGHGNPGSRWTEAEWAEWREQQSWKWRHWGDSEKDFYSFPKDPEQDTIQWDQFGYEDVEILPPEILGWLLLRRSGLPASARLSVLSSIGNKLDLATMERAMRDQEEELLLAEHQRHRGLDRPRRSFWVEQDSQWGLLSDELEEDLDEHGVLWVGDRLPEDVYPFSHVHDEPETAWVSWLPDGTEMSWEWFEDDFYAMDSDGVFWSWADTKTWLDVEDFVNTNPAEGPQTQEVYAAFNDRLRTFRESRTLNTAKQLSRGYYPMQMFKGKGKGKGKGKQKGSSKSSSKSSSNQAVLANFSKGGSQQKSGQKPGSATYTGCFICGAKDHDFRACPKRDSKPTSSSTPSTRTNFFVGRSVLMVSSVDDDASDDDGEPEPGAVLATLAIEHPGYAVIDTGATETIASLEALEAIMSLRQAKYGPEHVTVHQKHRKFRFGNGQEQRAASYVELPQLLAGCDVKLGVHALDTPGVPLLLSVKTLNSLKAIIDVNEGMICFTAVKEDHWLPLKRGPNGHLLLDLTTDWFAEQPIEDSALHVGGQIEVEPLPQPVDCGQDQKSSVSMDAMDANIKHVSDAELQHEQSEEELMTDAQHEQQCHESPQSSTNAPSGSSMLRGLPVLLALATASTSSPTSPSYVSAFPGGPREHGAVSAQSEAQISCEDQEQGFDSGPNTREVRPLQSRRTRSPGQQVPGISVHGPARDNGRRTRFVEWPQRPCHVEGVCGMSPQGVLCTGLRGKRDIPPSRTAGSRHRCCSQEGRQHDRERHHCPRELEQQSGECDRSRRVPEEQAQAVGGAAHQDDLSSKHQAISGDKGHQEGSQAGECRDSGTGGSHSPGGLCGDSAMMNSDEPFNKIGTLTEDQKAILQERANDYILEANDAMEEFFGTSGGIDLIEVCCPTDSKLTQTFLSRGRQALRVGLPAFDLSKRRGKDELKRIVKKERPGFLWFSLPCGPYSPIQELFNENTPEKLQKSEERKSRSRKLISNALEVALLQLELGGEIGWEWPRDNRGWQLPKVQKFFNMLEDAGKLFTARVDGCAYDLRDKSGALLKKPWKIRTSSQTMAMALQRTCPGGHDHKECLGGTIARDSGFYPQAMCDVIQKAVREMLNTQNMDNASIFPVFDAKPLVQEKTPLPDPLTESEKKNAEKLLSKLHRKTGHPSNKALASTLRHRGAHYEVVEMALKHQCPECQELRMAPLDPAVSLRQSETLWETMVMDNAEFPIDDKVIHCMIMVDEASRLVCPHFLFSHDKMDSRNATSSEVVSGIQDTWVRHYGLPGQIRMDPEGAFRSNELGAWAEERGVLLLPCAAEAHGQIGVVERAIQTIKNTTRQILQAPGVDAWDAIQQACHAHNELARVEGFSPFQWAFGRQPTHIGQMHEKGHDLPYLTSSAIAGSSMASNLRLRVQAQQSFLRQQAQEQVSRAVKFKDQENHTVCAGGPRVFQTHQTSSAAGSSSENGT